MSEATEPRPNSKIGHHERGQGLHPEGFGRDVAVKFKSYSHWLPLGKVRMNRGGGVLDPGAK